MGTETNQARRLNTRPRLNPHVEVIGGTWFSASVVDIDLKHVVSMCDHHHRSHFAAFRCATKQRRDARKAHLWLERTR